jgi:lipid II:glycine glycyltransferase (peptidoglycan interpeptide bridge formation enzyme)
MTRRVEVSPATVGGLTVRLAATGADSDPDWDGFVLASGGRPAQTTPWGRVKAASGWSADRVEVWRDQALVAGAQLVHRKLPAVGRVGYLDGGPLASGPSEIETVVEAIQDLCRRLGVRSLVVDPPLGSEPAIRAMQDHGFVRSHVKTALAATVTVDLTQSEEQILARMRSSTRQNIRKAERAGTVVRKGDRQDLPVVSELLASTASRQGFVSAEEDYLTALFDELDPLGQVALFIAEAEGAPVATILLVAFGGRVFYKRGGWSGTHGEWRPNESLHWAAMRWARESGFVEYDFDGIEPDVARAIAAGVAGPEPTHVTRFKLGFGGDVVLLPESLTYLPNPIVRLGYTTIFPKVRKWRIVKRAVKRLRSR